MTCNADLLCVEVYKDTQVRLVLDNVTTKPLSFRLFVSGDHLEEAQPVIYLDGPVRQTLMSFPNSGKPWGFEYRIHYGHESHVHDDGYLYTLPFAPGAGYQVSQSHTNIRPITWATAMQSIFRCPLVSGFTPPAAVSL